MKKLFALFALLTTTTIAGAFTLAWDPSPSPGILRYNVWASVGTGNPFSVIASTDQTLVLISTTVSTQYYVTAQDANGESVPSNIVTYTPTPPPPPPVIVPPPTPSFMYATAMSSSRIDVSWERPTDPSVKYVVLYRDGVQIATLQPTQSGYINTGLRHRTTYRYQVRAGNDAGLSGYSPTAYATTFKH